MVQLMWKRNNEMLHTKIKDIKPIISKALDVMLVEIDRAEAASRIVFKKYQGESDVRNKACKKAKAVLDHQLCQLSKWHEANYVTKKVGWFRPKSVKVFLHDMDNSDADAVRIANGFIKNWDCGDLDIFNTRDDDNFEWVLDGVVPFLPREYDSVYMARRACGIRLQRVIDQLENMPDNAIYIADDSVMDDVSTAMSFT